MNTIKFSVLTCFFIICYQNLQAQEPCWFSTPPTCKNSNFVYAVGIGQDRDVVKMKNRAEAEAIKMYMAQVHGIQLEDATYKDMVENGLEKIRISGRPLQYTVVRQGVDDRRSDIFYTLLLLPRNFSREEIRRDIVYPNEELCDNIQVASKHTNYSPTSTSIPTTQKFSVGQQHTITVFGSNGDKYSCAGKIAYLDASGQHGLLLVDESKYQRTYYNGKSDKYYRRIPTKGELELIYQNKNLLGLRNEYWSSTRSKKVANWEFYYTVNFSNGSSNSRDSYKDYYHLYVADF